MERSGLDPENLRERAVKVHRRPRCAWGDLRPQDQPPVSHCHDLLLEPLGRATERVTGAGISGGVWWTGWEHDPMEKIRHYH